MGGVVALQEVSNERSDTLWFIQVDVMIPWYGHHDTLRESQSYKHDIRVSHVHPQYSSIDAVATLKDQYFQYYQYITFNPHIHDF